MTDSGQNTDYSILDLFRAEVQAQTNLLMESLSVLGEQPFSPDTIAPLIKAASTIKGIATLVDLSPVVQVAADLEACLTTLSNPTPDQITALLQKVDSLVQMSRLEDEPLTELPPQSDRPTVQLQETITPLPYSASTLTAVVTLPVEAIAPPPDVTDEIRDEIRVDEPEAVLPSPVPVSLGDTSMLELFRLEVEAQANVLNTGLLALESQSHSPQALEALMRAAHSIKGAARIVALDAAVNLAHVMEDCFVAAQHQKVMLNADDIDVLLHGVDLLLGISQVEPSDLQHWLANQSTDLDRTRHQITAILNPDKSGSSLQAVTFGDLELAAEASSSPPASEEGAIASQPILSTVPTQASKLDKATDTGVNKDRVVRVSAENLNRIMGLAGESLIEANWLQPFADSLMILKKRQLELSKLIETFHEMPSGQKTGGEKVLESIRHKERECREILSDRLTELELFARRTGNLSDRLYREVIASHMRPFEDGVQSFPRMVRDVARRLGKQVKLEILGKGTPVDRDILTKLEAPLTHILRNAVDHGIEMPDERIAAGKSPEGTIRLEAIHRGGMLSITITDDGRGIYMDWLRQKIVSKGLNSAEMVAQMSDSELLEFLFLPGFSTAQQVTEISGRGVGLDIAKSMADEVGGTVRASTHLSKGTVFHFQLPLTLSVVRTLLVEIAGEPYAFPLARIEQIVMVNRQDIDSMENRQYFTMDQRNIGLVSAAQVLDLNAKLPQGDTLPVVVISEQSDYYGLVVDRFLGEHDLVVRPLDPRLGKVQDISAAALMGDGSPILIVDVSDLVRSVDKLLNGSHIGRLNRFGRELPSEQSDTRKRILVVDDSITVREMQRKILQNCGYRVDVTVDGMEGWHAICANDYDLVISDIDMPRLNGFELVGKIKTHPRYQSIPVIIVSYKDREGDRLRGLEVGADYYLTKSSINDESLVKAVLDLIGT